MAKYEVNSELIYIKTISETVKQKILASVCSVGFHRSSLQTSNLCTFTTFTPSTVSAVKRWHTLSTRKRNVRKMEFIHI